MSDQSHVKPINCHVAEEALPEHDRDDEREDRQQEIDNLRAQYTDEFQQVKKVMPPLDVLRSLSIEPPPELLNEEW